ncbi:prefoldin subunit alpha [Candidatus Woesearchaeota archaeon]|nr:prefoldin subunit alpha [Candidatus Woesearchaeota archaeon]
MANEELQKKYMEFQTIGQRSKELQESLLNLDHQINELKKLEEGLETINNSEVNDEILVSLGAGTYIKTKLIDNKKILMNVGSNTVTIKNIEDSIELVKLQIKELGEFYNKMNEDLRNNTVKLQELHEELELLMPK